MSGAPVPTAANNNIKPGFVTVNGDGQPIGFQAPDAAGRVFPISEGTTFFSTRADHQINSSHQLTLRFSYNPSDVSGIQDESQNQVLGPERLLANRCPDTAGHRLCQLCRLDVVHLGRQRGALQLQQPRREV